MTTIFMVLVTAFFFGVIIILLIYSFTDMKKLKQLQIETYDEIARKDAELKAQLAKEKEADEKKKSIHTGSSRDDFTSSLNIMHDYSNKD